jgi:hypothetical protein
MLLLGMATRVSCSSGVENACDIALRLQSVGIDVVLADVVNADTINIY